MLLLKNIAFFNQKDRIRYKIRNAKNVIEEKGFLVDHRDVKEAVRIGKFAFTKLSQNLDRKLRHLLFFALKWTNDDISIKPLKDKVEYSREDGDFPGIYVISDYMKYLKELNQVRKKERKEEIRIFSDRQYERFLENLVEKGFLTVKKADNKNYFTFATAPAVMVINYNDEKKLLKKELEEFKRKNIEELEKEKLKIEFK